MGKRQQRPWIVSDELWSLIEPLLPEPPPKQVEGRPRVPDRQALCGVLADLLFRNFLADWPAATGKAAGRHSVAGVPWEAYRATPPVIHVPAG